jgi:hypothetical protein
MFSHVLSPSHIIMKIYKNVYNGGGPIPRLFYYPHLKNTSLAAFLSRTHLPKEVVHLLSPLSVKLTIFYVCLRMCETGGLSRYPFLSSAAAASSWSWIQTLCVLLLLLDGQASLEPAGSKANRSRGACEQVQGKKNWETSGMPMYAWEK